MAIKPPKKKKVLENKKDAEVVEKTVEKRKKPTSIVVRRPVDLARDFDRLLERFRRDFEDILWPSERSTEQFLSRMPAVEIRVPQIDVEDRGKDFLLRAEMPGFKKEDIEVEATNNSVEIRSLVGWKYDDKTKNYVCKERECESFYRMVNLPEEIVPDKAEANLKEGILELVLTKKTPKQKKKINVTQAS